MVSGVFARVVRRAVGSARRPRLEILEDRIQPTTLAALTDIPAGTAPLKVVAADFNRDGSPDLAVSNFTVGTVSVLLSNGNGSFRQAPTIQGFVFPGPLSVADFNRDGKLDLAVGNEQSDTVVILLGKGDGTFTRV